MIGDRWQTLAIMRIVWVPQVMPIDPIMADRVAVPIVRLSTIVPVDRRTRCALGRSFREHRC